MTLKFIRGHHEWCFFDRLVNLPL